LRPGRLAIISTVTGVVLLVGAAVAFGATRERTTTTTPVDLNAPLGLTPADLAQWCKDRQAAGTDGLSYGARAWLRNCSEALGSTGGPVYPSPTGPTPTPSAT